MHTNAGMHTIRLRQPWQPRWLEAPANHQGLRLASYRRAFNCPTGLTPEQTIGLAIQRQEPQASAAELRSGARALTSMELVLVSVALNEQPLALTQPTRDGWQADLTGALLPFNQVDIVVQLPLVDTPPPPLTDLFAVQLEIA